MSSAAVLEGDFGRDNQGRYFFGGFNTTNWKFHLAVLFGVLDFRSVFLEHPKLPRHRHAEYGDHHQYCSPARSI
jgi:hypothetical protein